MDFNKYNPHTNGRWIALKEIDFSAVGFPGETLNRVYRDLTDDPRDAELITESCTLEEIDEAYNPADEDWDEDDGIPGFILESVTAKFGRLEKRLAVLGRAVDKNGTLSVQEIKIGPQRKVGGYATVTGEILLDDLQSIFGVFHSPGLYQGKKIGNKDEIIGYRWFLNKRDITHLIEPEDGRELTVQTVGKRLAKLAEKNSANFARRSKAVKEKQLRVEEMAKQLEDLEREKSMAEREIDDLQGYSDQLDEDILNKEEELAAAQAENETLQQELENYRAKEEGEDGAREDQAKADDPVLKKWEAAVMEFQENAGKYNLWGVSNLSRPPYEFWMQGHDHNVIMKYSPDEVAQKFSVIITDRIEDNQLFKKYRKKVDKVKGMFAAAIGWIEGNVEQVGGKEEDEAASDADNMTSATAMHDHRTKEMSSVVFRQAMDDQSNFLGYVYEKYDGTKEDARRVAAKITEKMYNIFPDVSNMASRIGATDENGNPKFTISPNFKHVRDVNDEEAEARFIWGDFVAGTAPAEGEDDVEIEPDANETKFNGILKLSADTPNELRPSDVDRVLDAAEDAGILDEFYSWLKAQGLKGKTEATLDKAYSEMNAEPAETPEPVETEPEPTPEPEPVEPAEPDTTAPSAVQTANDIIAGKYDDRPLKELMDMADEVFELDEDEYGDLMDELDAYLTSLTKQAAA